MLPAIEFVAELSITPKSCGGISPIKRSLSVQCRQIEINIQIKGSTRVMNPFGLLKASHPLTFSASLNG